jgi:cardiolipin synthase
MLEHNFLLLFLSLSYLLAIVAIIHVILNHRTPQGALAWIMGFIALPWLTLVFYLVFGQRRFEGYVIARRTEEQHLTNIVRLINQHICDDAADRLKDYTELAIFSSLTKISVSFQNHYQLLQNGEATFNAMFAAIEQAKHYVLLEFYIVRDDDTGRRLQNLLLQKLTEGVEVYFLFDDFGSVFLPSSYVKALELAGARMASFNSQLRHIKRFQINFRNHRKILVCDGDVGFLGGLNVGDEYRGLSRRFAHWRDTHLKLSGPSVLTLQLTFLEDWYWATESIPELNWQALPETDQTACPKNAECPQNEGAVLILPTGPADPFETCGLFFLGLIESAKDRLWIASPYFVPDLQIMSALQLAALRGVDVRILIPENPDHKMVYYAAYAYLQTAEQYGIQIFRYQTGFMHQKVILVDQRYASVGTANFDNRSMRLNFEISALIIDPAFIAEVEAMLLNDFTKCRLMSTEQLPKSSLWFKLLCQAARLMAPML